MGGGVPIELAIDQKGISLNKTKADSEKGFFSKSCWT